MNIVKIMVPKCFTVFLHENQTVRQGLEIIAHHGYTAILVLDEQERYVGSVTEGDFLRCILNNDIVDKHGMEKHRISEIVRRDFCPALSIDAEEETVIDAVLQQNFVPIVDARNALCGIVTRRRLIAYMAGKELSL